MTEAESAAMVQQIQRAMVDAVNAMLRKRAGLQTGESPLPKRTKKTKMQLQVENVDLKKKDLRVGTDGPDSRAAAAADGNGTPARGGE